MTSITQLRQCIHQRLACLPTTEGTKLGDSAQLWLPDQSAAPPIWISTSSNNLRSINQRAVLKLARKVVRVLLVESGTPDCS
jgi:hypothetical protein